MLAVTNTQLKTPWPCYHVVILFASCLLLPLVDSLNVWTTHLDHPSSEVNAEATTPQRAEV